MKNSKMLIAVLLCFSMNLAILSHDVSKIKSEHLKMVAKYEEQTNAQRMIAAEHSKLKKDFEMMAKFHKSLAEELDKK